MDPTGIGRGIAAARPAWTTSGGASGQPGHERLQSKGLVELGEGGRRQALVVRGVVMKRPA